MTTRTAAALVIAFLLVAIDPAPAAAQRFGAETFTLANGLQVVVVTNRRVPAVTHMIWYKVGGADDPRGVSGIAHFLEHLMFRGTSETPPGEFSRIVARNGGRENAFTSHDFTAYHQTVAADRLETVMKLEAERMTGLVLTDDVVLPERDVVLEERRARVENEPASLMNEQVSAALFVHHPYGIPIIGWQHEIRKLTTADAFAFYRDWYAPNNAILVVAGDVDAVTLRPLAEKYYGVIPARPVPGRSRVAEPPHAANARIEMTSPRVVQPGWSRTYHAPSYIAGETKHVYALQVLADVIGGGTTARLHRALVLDQKIATGAGAYYNPGSLDISSFGFWANPRQEVPVETVERAVETEIRRILEEGASAEEVERAKTRMQAESVYARDSLEAPARIIGSALTTGRTLDDVERWPELIGGVTVEEVNTAARAILQSKPWVGGLLLPARQS